jgi:hypothetical protein
LLPPLAGALLWPCRLGLPCQHLGGCAEPCAPRPALLPLAQVQTLQDLLLHVWGFSSVVGQLQARVLRALAGLTLEQVQER